jgi:hypothetical protein
MLFVTTVRRPSSSYKATMERFKAGGGLPLTGVKMIGRWNRADGLGCTVVCR